MADRTGHAAAPPPAVADRRLARAEDVAPPPQHPPPANPDDHHDAAHEIAPPARTRWVVLTAAIVLVALAVLFVVGLVPRLRQRHALDGRAARAKDALPVVDVEPPTRGPAVTDLTYPGEMVAIQEAPIYAQISGYLKARYVEIGDKVKGGQLMAVVDAPQVDQQLNQGRADLNAAKANVVKAQSDLDLANVTYKRYLDAGVAAVGQQAIDQNRVAAVDAQNTLAAAKATAGSQEANVEGLVALKGFERVTALFDGTVTARNVDAGALINANGANNNVELFHLADATTLRVYVSVPQSAAPLVKVGQAATIRVREYPGRTFAGKVAHTADALAAASRTMLVEVRVPNRDGPLMPGMYGQVTFHVADATLPLRVRSTALLFDEAGTRLPVVGPDDKLALVPVTVGADDGTHIEVLTGITPTDRVAVSQVGDLAAGDKVRPHPIPPATRNPATMPSS